MTESDKSGSCDPQEVNKTDNAVVDDSINLTFQDLESNDFIGAEVTSFETEFHNVDKLTLPNIHEMDSNSIIHHEIDNTEFLYDKTLQTNMGNDTLLDTIELNKTMLDILPQETQVFAISRNNVEDDLLTVTKTASKELIGSSVDQLCTDSSGGSSGTENLPPVAEKPSSLNNSPKLLLYGQDLPSSQKSPCAQKSPSLHKLTPLQEIPSQQQSPSPQSSQQTSLLSEKFTLVTSSEKCSLVATQQKSLFPEKSSLVKSPKNCSVVPTQQNSLLSEKSSLVSSPGKCSLVSKKLLTPHVLDRAVTRSRILPRVQLVDYDCDVDSDSEDDEVLGGGSMVVRQSIVDHKSTDDSTDTMSDDSDSNSLINESCGKKLNALPPGLAHDLSDTGTVSSDERMEPCAEVKNSLESIALLSPPHLSMKLKSCFTPSSPVLNKRDTVSSMMDLDSSSEIKKDDISLNKRLEEASTSAGLKKDDTFDSLKEYGDASFEDKDDTFACPAVTNDTCVGLMEVDARVSMVETSQSTISTLTVSSEVPPPISSSSLLNTSTLSAPTISPVFDKTAQSTVSSADITTLTTTMSGSISSIFNEDFASENPSSTPVPTTNYHDFSDTFDSIKGETVSTESHVNAGESGKDDFRSLVNFATNLVLPSLIRSPPVAGDQIPDPDSMPNAPSILESQNSDPIQSTSIPIPSPPVCSSFVSDGPDGTITQKSSPTPTVEAAHLTTDNNNTPVATFATSSNEGTDNVTDIDSTQSPESHKINEAESSFPDQCDANDNAVSKVNESVNVFPSALKLSIDLSVLPHKKKVLQRAKWATLLTTPVPVLRERKRTLKSTVTVKSTLVKSDRKPTTKSGSPKKQREAYISDSVSQHDIGEVVWSKFSHWDPWPCKIILHSDVEQLEPPIDQVNYNQCILWDCVMCRSRNLKPVLDFIHQLHTYYVR